MRQPTDRERAAFNRACRALAKLTEAGFELYVTPGSIHLLTGPSHDGSAAAIAQPENVAETAGVPGIGGGDW